MILSYEFIYSALKPRTKSTQGVGPVSNLVDSQ